MPCPELLAALRTHRHSARASSRPATTNLMRPRSRVPVRGGPSTFLKTRSPGVRIRGSPRLASWSDLWRVTPCLTRRGDNPSWLARQTVPNQTKPRGFPASQKQRGVAGMPGDWPSLKQAPSGPADKLPRCRVDRPMCSIWTHLPWHRRIPGQPRMAARMLFSPVRQD
jgi:hypothetical protein